MSTPNGPTPRRRRIAGESARPAAKTTTSAKPVVKKPVSSRKAEAANASTAAPASTPLGKVSTPAVPKVRTASRPSIATGSAGGRELVATLVAAALLAAGIAMTFMGYQHWQGESFADSSAAATKTAGEAIETIMSYQYDQLDDHRAAVKDVMTSKYFQNEYVKTTAPALEELAPQRKIKVDAKVRNVAQVPCGEKCSADKAQVLMFVDLDRRIEGDQTATVFGNRVLVDMTKVDGDWLVANVTGL